MGKEKIIDTNQLVDMVAGFKGHSIAFIRTMTEPDLTVKSRATKIPMELDLGFSKGDVRKISLMSIRLGYDYEKSVTNELKKEGKDSSEYVRGTSWHIPMPLSEGVSKTIHVHKEDTGKKYLYYQPNKHTNSSWCKSEYVNMKTHKLIPKSLLKDYLPLPSKPKNQGVDEGREIIPQTVHIENVKRLSFEGTVYNLI